jgi:hypothetical protein
MGWVFSIILFVLASFSGNEAALIAAGLFAIAGEIGFQSSRKEK